IGSRHALEEISGLNFYTRSHVGEHMTFHHVLLVVENSTQVRVGDQDGLKQDTLSATDVADGLKRGKVIGIGNGTGGHGSSDGHPLVERCAVFRVLVEVFEEADSHHWLESIVAGG